MAVNFSGANRANLRVGPCLRSAAALLAVGLCAVAAGCGGYGFADDEAGSSFGGRGQREAGSSLEYGGSPYRGEQEAGSTFNSRFQLPAREVAPRRAAPPEAGSGLAPRRGILFDRPEAGSTLDPRNRPHSGFDPLPRTREIDESGSTLSPRRFDPSSSGYEAGSLISPRRTGRYEAGSRLDPEAGSVLVRRRANPAAAGNGAPIDLDVIYQPADRGSSTSWVTRKRLTPLALVLIALGGAALILFTLFKLGMASPYAREQLTRRLDLCCDLADQLDAFLDAVRREDWDRCQTVLDHFHATNGRRAVLLSNRTNSALFRFLQVAINCRLSGRDPEYRRNLENKFALAVEALRKSSRQSELLSLENRQFLVDANRSYRKLRERA